MLLLFPKDWWNQSYNMRNSKNIRDIVLSIVFCGWKRPLISTDKFVGCISLLLRFRAIYDTQTRSSEELLHLSGKKKIHAQNLQILMVQVYKCLNNISRPLTWYYFKQKKCSLSLKEYTTTWGKQVQKKNSWAEYNTI